MFGLLGDRYSARILWEGGALCLYLIIFDLNLSKKYHKYCNSFLKFGFFVQYFASGLIYLASWLKYLGPTTLNITYLIIFQFQFHLDISKTNSYWLSICLTSKLLVNFCHIFAFSSNILLQDSNIWPQVSNIWDGSRQILHIWPWPFQNKFSYWLSIRLTSKLLVNVYHIFAFLVNICSPDSNIWPQDVNI